MRCERTQTSRVGCSVRRGTRDSCDTRKQPSSLQTRRFLEKGLTALTLKQSRGGFRKRPATLLGDPRPGTQTWPHQGPGLPAPSPASSACSLCRGSRATRGPRFPVRMRADKSQASHGPHGANQAGAQRPSRHNTHRHTHPCTHTRVHTSACASAHPAQGLRAPGSTAGSRLCHQDQGLLAAHVGVNTSSLGSGRARPAPEPGHCRAWGGTRPGRPALPLEHSSPLTSCPPGPRHDPSCPDWDTSPAPWPPLPHRAPSPRLPPTPGVPFSGRVWKEAGPSRGLGAGASSVGWRGLPLDGW